jgi:hypothetical protein
VPHARPIASSSGRSRQADASRWEAFVATCAEATFFHAIGWREIIADEFRHPTHYLIAERGAEIAGILPLAEVRSRLFGHSLVAVPFGVYGGPAANDADAERALIDAAVDLARSLGVDHLELRNRRLKCPDWPQQDLYVTVPQGCLPLMSTRTCARFRESSGRWSARGSAMA